MIPRRFRMAAALGLALTAAPADAQFFPGFRPGLYYSSPFGSFGMGFSSSFSFNQQWVNPYTGQFNRMTARLRESYAGLERKVDERTRELANALEQQTAISEILRVISSSPTNVQPVLDAVAKRAALLCDASMSRVLLADGGWMRPAAEYWDPAIYGSKLPVTERVPIDRSSISGRAVVASRRVLARRRDPCRSLGPGPRRRRGRPRSGRARRRVRGRGGGRP